MSENVGPADLEVHFGSNGESQALYVRGKLVHANDYGVAEKVFELLGVEVVYDSDFMLGQTRWGGAAKTLQEIKDFGADLQDRTAKAAELQRRAAELHAQAMKLLRNA